jgi:REJ domain
LSGSYEILEFVSDVVFVGLSSSFISAIDLKSSFHKAIDNVVPGVRRRDISVMRISFVSASSRKIMQETSVLPDVLVAATRDDELSVLSSHRTLSTSPAAVLTFNVSVVVSRLGTNNGTVAYLSLTRQLNTSMSSTFYSAMQSLLPMSANLERTYYLPQGYALVSVTSPTFPPTSAPTAVAIIPIVSSINVTAALRSSLSLTVTLQWPSSTGGINGGSLYCIALSDNNYPSSIGAIKSSGFDGAFSKGSAEAIPRTALNTVMVDLTISGLSAVQSYSIYCYAENYLGAGNSLQAVLSKGITALTACCKDISHLNFPEYVFSDGSKYSASSPSLYVFTYELSSAPVGSLVVTPLIELNGVKSNDVTAMPLTSSFSRTSSLSGQFVLSADASIGGNYSISLSLSGADAIYYSSRKSTVQLLSPSALLPAPSLSSVQLSDSGQTVLVSFNSPTDKGGILDATWQCDRLFSFVSASLSKCTWLSASTVSVSFPIMLDAASTAKYLRAGDAVTLHSSLLRAFCSGSAATCASNPSSPAKSSNVQLPLNPEQPTIVITAPLNIGACSDLSIDATASYGNGGRAYSSVVWTVSATQQVNTSTVLNILQASSLSYQVFRPITLAKESLTAATYTFALRLTNFLGATSSKSFDVTVKGEKKDPEVAIIGSTFRSIFASTSLSIDSVASFSGCATASSSLIFTWSVKVDGANTAITSISPNPTKFVLSPYTLAVDKTYAITVTAAAGASSSFSTVTVYVARGALTALITGGSKRTVPVDKELYLDATQSSDADVSKNAPTSLLYQVRRTILFLSHVSSDSVNIIEVIYLSLVSSTFLSRLNFATVELQHRVSE